MNTELSVFCMHLKYFAFHLLAEIFFSNIYTGMTTYFRDSCFCIVDPQWDIWQEYNDGWKDCDLTIHFLFQQSRIRIWVNKTQGPWQGVTCSAVFVLWQWMLPCFCFVNLFILQNFFWWFLFDMDLINTVKHALIKAQHAFIQFWLTCHFAGKLEFNCKCPLVHYIYFLFLSLLEQDVAPWVSVCSSCGGSSNRFIIVVPSIYFVIPSSAPQLV